jgi:hypothetical protein
MFTTHPQGTSYQSSVPHHHLQQSEIQNTYGQHADDPPRQTKHQPLADMVGLPIHFLTGQFAGQTIRAELDEIQKADLGRKYARVDRRPLDPPPVIRLRFFNIREDDVDQERGTEIKNYDEIQTIGLMSTVDLFPVPNESWTSRSPTQTSFASSSTLLNGNGNFIFSSPQASPPTEAQSPSTPTSPSFKDVIHYVGNYAITESSKVTSSLVGATFVQPAIVDYEGKKAIIFVFSDLAVKIEGTFLLRYRVFDIFSRPRDREDLLVQAECYGRPFRVYSTKEFPGLQASTDLTKHLARWGVRLNIRETERKRRKKGELGSPLVDPNFKRKRTPGSEDDEASDED